jgi:hypothetical protein
MVSGVVARINDGIYLPLFIRDFVGFAYFSRSSDSVQNAVLLCEGSPSLQISPFKLAGQLAHVITENKRARPGHNCQAVNRKGDVKGSS